jgi:cholesterol oxidase
MDRHRNPDFDWIVIGSGFGGSVSALRLAEKGYRVAVLECGREFPDRELPTSAWQLRRFLWKPELGLKGILRVTPFKDVLVLSGSGVGGGSLVYAATLYRAEPAFFADPQWRDLDDWQARLRPHYETAERMLGVTPVPFESPCDVLLKEFGAQLGCADRFRKTNVGIYFGEEGRKAADPYFGGEGPERTGCLRCGDCMLGCPHGAKNTLPRNYLWLARRRGVEIRAGRTVTDVRPLGAADGSDGYAVTSEHSGAWLRKRRSVLTARGVVFAAGALGTNTLLANCVHRGSLPRISPRLGELVRTNSESIQAVTLPNDRREVWRSVSITGSLFPDAASHIEFLTWGRGWDAFGYLFTLLSGPGNRLMRPLRALGAIARRPWWLLSRLWPFGWAERTIGTGIMQTLDNAIAFRPKRRWFGGIRLRTEQDPQRPIPTHFPLADEATRWLARSTGGVAQGFVTESFFSTPTTAHILGGAVIGKDADHGVVNARHEVYGYRNLLVCDGAAMPANPGVNPSLTITAMAEAAMTEVPDCPTATVGTAASTARMRAPADAKA